jgi:hypothetical protein
MARLAPLVLDAGLEARRRREDGWARVEDAGAADRALRRAFFFINPEDSGTVLDGTIILRGRRSLFG